MKSHIHLHLHSEFSLLDSNLKIGPLIQRVKTLNMPAVALTDHGNILGALGFYKEAKRNDVKPIIGSELYVASGSRKEKPDKNKHETNYHHLVALVKNAAGYHNLAELITRSFTEGFYRKPRIDRELLSRHHEGLVILSACIKGEIPHLLLLDHDDQAIETARWYRDLFKDDYYIEIQNHRLKEQIDVLPKLIGLAKDLSIPLVATNDVHYLTREDSEARDILICLQTNDVLSNPERPMKMSTAEMYLKSSDEMRELFADVPESISNTMDVAAKCNYDFKLGEYFLPEFSVPDKQTRDDFFQKICTEGFDRLKQKFDRRFSEHEYKERLDYEIEKIREMGFPGYFLIVWDIVRFARSRNISVGPGRGSVVGSFVAYVMGITSIDPLKYDLIFERFLNPERISLPDIDIDFDPERREEVIDYIRNTYGRENVAQIVTFGKMKAKLAIRDIGRVLEIPLSDVDRLAKLIPDGPKVSLRKEIDSNPELQKEIKRISENKRLIDFALKLENTVRHTSMHAAGVVIAPKKLTEFMPLYKTRDEITTQFEKDEVEEIGLLKMDILGLKTLTIIKNIIQTVRKSKQIDIDLDNISLEDKKTFRIFQRGDTDGIFQFESSGMREYLKKSKPQKIEDLIVLNALYRPGPLGSGMADQYVNRKLGRERVSYIFPELEEILQDTYGIIVFQEQVMQISVKIAGFAMSKADEMRKIMGKKLTHKLPALEKEFMAGAAKRGHPRKKVEELFSQMATFAEYGFNKSHSTAYAFLAYQTAYLKAHFPLFFMGAHLTSEAEKTSTSSKVIQYISESKKMGIEILPPDINRSGENFGVVGSSAILFGLKGLKNVGESAVKSILAARSEGGDFKNYSDFITRIDLSRVNKTVLESLIKSGAMDPFGIRRRALYESVEEVIRQAVMLAKRRDENQRPLFGQEETAGIVVPQNMLDAPEWNENQIIQGEKEITGIYLSHNPLERYQNEIKKVSNTTISKIEAGEFSGETVRLGGVITQYKQRKSRKGDFYGELFFEDLTGRIKVLTFKDKWDGIKADLRLDFPYYLEGRLPYKDDKEINIYLENLAPLDHYLRKKARKIIIKIDYSLLTPAFSEKLDQVIQKNRDSVPYIIAVYRDDGYRTIIASEDGQGLKATVAMKRDIEKVSGENSVEIVY